MVILPRLITCVRCQVDGVLERFLSKVMDMQQRHQSGHALWWMVLVLFCIGIVAYVCFFGVHTSKRQEPLTEADMDQLKPVIAPSSTAHTMQDTGTVTDTFKAANVPVSDTVSKPKEVTSSSVSEAHFKLARSPYPAPGEIFKQPIKPTLLVSAQQAEDIATAGQLQAKPGQIIPWDHARQYVGQTITIEGKVVLANKTRSVCFLNFTENWRGRFYVILFEKVLGSWDQSPEKYFLNKTVQITGQVKERKGVPQIQVTHSTQIKILN